MIMSQSLFGSYSAVLLGCLYIAQALAGPIAPHLSVVVNVGEEVVISLPGYNTDGKPLNSTIKSLPMGGSIFQISQVCSVHNYGPFRGSPITSTPTLVTGSKNRIVYARPSRDFLPFPEAKWDTVQYEVTDGSSTSAIGTVYFVPPSQAVVTSTFDDDADGWKVAQLLSSSRATKDATWDITSRGAINRFIYGTEDSINKDSFSGKDADIWYFVAPPKFLGKLGIAYGGRLEFTLASFAGDFSSLNQNLHLIRLECASCDSGKGVTLALPLDSSLSFTGTTRAYTIPLDISAGWLQDSRNVLIAWKQPTAVLEGLTALHILGDFTTWYESIAIDDVRVIAASAIPISCYETSGLSQFQNINGNQVAVKLIYKTLTW